MIIILFFPGHILPLGVSLSDDRRRGASTTGWALHVTTAPLYSQLNAILNIYTYILCLTVFEFVYIFFYYKKLFIFILNAFWWRILTIFLL